MRVKKLFQVFILILIVAFIGSCGVSNESSTNVNGTTDITTTENQTIPTYGKVVLGNLADATVKIYEIRDNGALTLKWVETTSHGNSLNEIGKFNTHADELNPDKFYLYEVEGGCDWDADDDGVMDDNCLENKGIIRALAKGKDIKAVGNEFVISCISEFIYEKIKKELKNGFNESGLSVRLQNFIKRVIKKDINNDGYINIKDMIVFDPKTDESRLSEFYKQNFRVIINKIHNGEQPINFPPKITIVANTTQVNVGENLFFYAIASDPDGTITSIDWYSSKGNLLGTGSRLMLQMAAPGIYKIYAVATDDEGGTGKSNIITVYVNKEKWNDITGAGFLTKIKIYGNTIIIGGVNGVLVYSDDMLHWKHEQTGLKNDITAIGFGDGKYVVGGSNGEIACKIDGKWHQTYSSWSTKTGIVYFRNEFYFSDSKGNIFRSSDCVNWKKFYTSKTPIVDLVTMQINGQEVMLAPTSDGKLIIFREDDTKDVVDTGLGKISDLYISKDAVYVTDGKNIAYKDFSSNSHWKVINTPYQNITSFAVGDDGVLVKGSDGNDHGFYFSKDWKNWKKVDESSYTEQDIAYLEKEDKFIYSYYGSQLMIFDPTTETLSDISIAPKKLWLNYAKFNGKLFVADEEGGRDCKNLLDFTSDGYTWAGLRYVGNKDTCIGARGLAFDQRGDVLIVGNNRQYIYIDSANIDYSTGIIKDVIVGTLPDNIMLLNHSLTDTVWDGKKFVVVTSTKEIVTTTDGVSWKSYNVPFNFAYRIKIYNGYYYVASKDGLYKSLDLINWEKVLSGRIVDMEFFDGDIYATNTLDLIILRNDGNKMSINLNYNIYEPISCLKVINNGERKTVFLGQGNYVYKIDINKDDISSSVVSKQRVTEVSVTSLAGFITDIGSTLVYGRDYGISVYDISQ